MSSRRHEQAMRRRRNRRPMGRQAERRGNHDSAGQEGMTLARPGSRRRRRSTCQSGRALRKSLTTHPRRRARRPSVSSAVISSATSQKFRNGRNRAPHRQRRRGPRYFWRRRGASNRSLPSATRPTVLSRRRAPDHAARAASQPVPLMNRSAEPLLRSQHRNNARGASRAGALSFRAPFRRGRAAGLLTPRCRHPDAGRRVPAGRLARPLRRTRVRPARPRAVP